MANGDLIAAHTYSTGDLLTANNLNAFLLEAKLKDGVIEDKHFSENALAAITRVALRALYKVGDYFITHNTENPAGRFGGTWQLVKDRFLIGAGGELQLLAEGGEKNHTLTVAEMPSHSHSLGYKVIGYGHGGGNVGERYLHTDTPYTDTYSAGGGQPHNNMPPYRAVYIWVKISDEDAE